MNTSQRFSSFLPTAAISFALFGALLVLVGATQDELARSLALDLSRSGLLAAAMVLGIGIGVFAGGPLVDRIDRRMLFIGAVGTTGTALLTVDPAMGFGRAFAHVLVAGLGGGLYETVLNTETIERYHERSVKIMTLLHAATTVGAIVAPLVLYGLSLAALPADPIAVFRTVGALHVALLLLAFATPFSPPARAAGTTSAGERVLTPALVALCVAAFAYIGVESAITAFSIPYAIEALELEADRGRTAISFFWMGLLAGRLAFAWRVSSDAARPAIAAGAAASVVILCGAVFGWTAVELLTTLVGFSLGGVFPLLVALAGRRTPHAPGSAVGLVAGLGSMGGVVIPWLTGVGGDRFGIAVAVGALSFWCLMISLSVIVAERAHPQRVRPKVTHATTPQ